MLENILGDTVRFLEVCKDGGPDSPVDAYVLVEFKGLFSVMLLKFNKGRREAFHTHAFNALTWFLKGDLVEERLVDGRIAQTKYIRGPCPKVTLKENLHRVEANKDSWCLTLRGPWAKIWTEYEETSNVVTTLTHGRQIVGKEKAQLRA